MPSIERRDSCGDGRRRIGCVWWRVDGGDLLCLVVIRCRGRLIFSNESQLILWRGEGASSFAARALNCLRRWASLEGRGGGAPAADMSTTPSSGGSFRKSGHRRIDGIRAEDDESSDESVDCGRGYGGYEGGMLPIFLNDQSDLIEVMLELDEDSMVVRSVTTPTSAAAAAASAGRASSGSLSRSSSTASRIRRKLAWLFSPIRRRKPADETTDGEHSSSPGPAAANAMSSRDARRIRAQLERTREGAQRALKGLRFISQTTTGTADANELWRRVEERFAALADNGLLARDDFAECIGPVLLSITFFSPNL